MNTRTIAIVLLALVVVGGGAVAFGPFSGGDGSPPFDTGNNTPAPTDENQMPDGVVDGQVTEEAVALNSIQIAQQKATITLRSEQQETTTTTRVVYTPENSHKVFRANGNDVREYFYTPDFTAVQEFQSNGYELSLNDPQNQISDHTDEAFLRSLVRSTNLTFDERTTENGTTYLHFTADEVTDSTQSPLARNLGVSEITSVNTARLVMTESGIITNVTFEAQVEDGDESYPISRSYALEMTPDVSVSQPSWVQEALATNAGVSAYIPSDSELVLQHKYGRTIQTGDEIQIQTPSGKTYTKEVDDSFGPDDQVVLTRTDGTVEMTVNPNSSVSGDAFLTESGQYVITIQTQDQGVVTVTTTRKAGS